MTAGVENLLRVFGPVKSRTWNRAGESGTWNRHIKALVPRREDRFYKPLDSSVYFRILGGVEVVDVACELDATVVLECHIGWEPLAGVGPVRMGNRGCTNRETIVFWRFFLFYNLSFARIFLDGAAHPDNFVSENAASTVN